MLRAATPSTTALLSMKGEFDASAIRCCWPSSINVFSWLVFMEGLFDAFLEIVGVVRILELLVAREGAEIMGRPLGVRR